MGRVHSVRAGGHLSHSAEGKTAGSAHNMMTVCLGASGLGRQALSDSGQRCDAGCADNGQGSQPVLCSQASPSVQHTHSIQHMPGRLPAKQQKL